MESSSSLIPLKNSKLEIELDRAFFFRCSKLDSKNNQATQTRLGKTRINLKINK